jgi:hypothetical protein
MAVRSGKRAASAKMATSKVFELDNVINIRRRETRHTLNVNEIRQNRSQHPPVPCFPR